MHLKVHYKKREETFAAKSQNLINATIWNDDFWKTQQKQLSSHS